MPVFDCLSCETLVPFHLLLLRWLSSDIWMRPKHCGPGLCRPDEDQRLHYDCFHTHRKTRQRSITPFHRSYTHADCHLSYVPFIGHCQGTSSPKLTHQSAKQARYEPPTPAHAQTISHGIAFIVPIVHMVINRTASTNFVGLPSLSHAKADPNESSKCIVLILFLYKNTQNRKRKKNFGSLVSVVSTRGPH